MVFQNYALYPHMSVFDNMAYGLKIRGVAEGRDRAARATRPRRSSSSTPLLTRKPRAALRRPAPARGHGPRHRARARGVPVRRAAVQPRRQAARADARSKSRSCTGASATTDLYVTHDQVEAMTLADSADRDERRPRRADRHADGGLSSGRPTTFVAGFIGSPAMNLIGSAGCGPPWPRGCAAGSHSRGAAEDLAVADRGAGAADGFTLDVTVEAPEPVGAETFVLRPPQLRRWRRAPGHAFGASRSIVRLPGQQAPPSRDAAAAACARRAASSASPRTAGAGWQSLP